MYEKRNVRIGKSLAVPCISRHSGPAAPSPGRPGLGLGTETMLMVHGVCVLMLEREAHYHEGHAPSCHQAWSPWAEGHRSCCWMV